jgi:hypothetical protein
MSHAVTEAAAIPKRVGTIERAPKAAIVEN